MLGTHSGGRTISVPWLCSGTFSPLESRAESLQSEPKSQDSTVAPRKWPPGGTRRTLALYRRVAHWAGRKDRGYSHHKSHCTFSRSVGSHLLWCGRTPAIYLRLRKWFGAGCTLCCWLIPEVTLLKSQCLMFPCPRKNDFWLFDPLRKIQLFSLLHFLPLAFVPWSF